MSEEEKQQKRESSDGSLPPILSFLSSPSDRRLDDADACFAPSQKGGDDDFFDLTQLSTSPPRELHEIWFELSRHTGRLHLHASADGSQPLGIRVDPYDYWDMAGEAIEALSCYEKLIEAREKAAKLEFQGVPPGLILGDGAKWLLVKMVADYRGLKSRIKNQVGRWVMVLPYAQDC